jgi:hypothetical protein
MLMSEFITAQKQIQLLAPELIAKTAEEKVRAEMKSEEQTKRRSSKSNNGHSVPLTQ